MIEFCTTVARAELANARVLAEDVRAHHGATLRVFVSDDRDAQIDGADEPFAIVSSSELDLADLGFERLAMLYELSELTGVVVPLVVRALLRAGASEVIFLGAQTGVFAPLDAIARHAAERGVAFVPRRRRPLPSGHGALDEAALLDTGLFAPSIVGASPEALEPFDAWARVVTSLDPGDHADLRRTRARGWIDHLLAGGYVSLLDDPAVGVALWNLDERALEARDGDVLVEGRPLCTFDFSGYDLDAGHVLAPVSAPVAALCKVHATRLRHARRASDDEISPLEQLDDGTVIDPVMRALYREAWIDATDPEVDPPNPHAPGGTNAFVRWLREPTLPDIAPRVGRYLAHVWSSSALLRDEFPELDPSSAEMFERLCRSHDDVPECVLPTDAETEQRRAERRLARPRGARPAGVNIVGYMGAALGLGEVARNMAHALQAAGVPVAAVSNPAASRDVYDVASMPPEAAPYDVNLFVVTADAFGPLAGKLGPDFFAERRNIGLWFWEAERFRHEGPGPATVLLDELWVASEFARGAVEAASTGLQVDTVRVPVTTPTVSGALDRRALGLPEDRFLFLFTFDYFSVTKRKNPLGLIDAYVRAFDASDGAMLIVKSINGGERCAELEATRAAAAGRPDVIVWDEYLAPDRHAALLRVCDSYVSLHRAEGLGLTMAEAMALAKPVIATGYSGNLEFMDDDVAFLVRSNLEPIGLGVDPYPPDARWAEPDLEHAAAQMRHVFDDREHAAQVGRRAAEAIQSQWSSAAVGPRLAELIDQVRARPRDPKGGWRVFFMRGWRNRVRHLPLRVYGFDWLADGFPLDPSMHRLAFSMRSGVRGRLMPPDPDGEDATERMVKWLNTPIAPRRRSVVSRYLVQYWHDHPELQERFPAVESDRGQARAYVDWVGECWHTDTDIDYRLVPAPVAPSAP